MLSVVGIYKNGIIKLDKVYTSEAPLKVIVTFLDDVQLQPKENLLFSDFSFVKSQKNLEGYTGTLSDEIIEERRNEL